MRKAKKQFETLEQRIDELEKKLNELKELSDRRDISLLNDLIKEIKSGNRAEARDTEFSASDIPEKSSDAEQTAADESEPAEKDWSREFWYIKDEKGVTVKRYLGSSTDEIIVPEIIEGMKVVELGESAFEDCKVRRVILPDTIRIIQSRAFLNCTELRKINLPSALREIHESAFSHCGIESVEFPENLTLIEPEAFSVSSLKSVSIPPGIPDIAEKVFDNCDDLTEVNLSYGVKTIGAGAFGYCANLESIRIPESISKICSQAFALTGYKAGKFEVFVDGNTEIENGSFDNRIAVIYCRRDSKTMLLAKKYHYSCEETPGANNSPADEKNFFDELTDFGSETDIPERDWSKEFKYAMSNGGIIIKMYIGSQEDTVVVPDKINGEHVVGIGSDAFKGCDKIKRIILPDTLILIGSNAFHSCHRLEEINMPSSLRGIGDYAFKSCGITKAELPENLVEIGVSAFAYSCLESVTIPSKVQEIKKGTFSGCADLSKAEIAYGVRSIGPEAFSMCSSLTDIQIPISVTDISNHAFYETGKNFKTLNIKMDHAPTCHPNAFYDNGTVNVCCVPGSPAAKWAEEKGFNVIKNGYNK